MLNVRAFAKTFADHFYSIISGLVAAVICTVWAVYKIEDFPIASLKVAVIGISFFFALDLIFEGRKLTIARLSGLAFLILYYFWFSNQTKLVADLSFFGLFVFSHLAVSLAPWIKSKFQASSEVVWNHNWTLFVHVIRISLQIGILMLGFSLGLVVIEKLFGFPIPTVFFAAVNSFFGFFLSSLLLVTAFKENIDTKGLTQVLTIVSRTSLTPVAILYFLICYVYGFTILITRNWPKGIVGNLVSGLTVVILFAWLAIWPQLQKQQLPRLQQLFWQNAFRLLLAPLLLLANSLYIRVADHGWSDMRLNVLYLLIWTLALSIYYWSPLKRHLVWIPATLAVLMVVYAVTPVSPGWLSQTIYVAKIRSEFQKASILLNDKGQYKATRALDVTEQDKLVEDLKNLCLEAGAKKVAEVLLLPLPNTKASDYYYHDCYVSSTAEARKSALEIMFQQIGIASGTPEKGLGKPIGRLLFHKYQTPTFPSLLREGFGVFSGYYKSSDMPSEDGENTVRFFITALKTLGYQIRDGKTKSVDFSKYIEDIESNKPIEILIQDPTGELLLKFQNIEYRLSDDGKVLVESIALHYHFRQNATK